MAESKTQDSQTKETDIVSKIKHVNQIVNAVISLRAKKQKIECSHEEMRLLMWFVKGKFRCRSKRESQLYKIVAQKMATHMNTDV